MSRIGKQPIPIPQKTEVAVEGSLVRVKGPLGELSRSFAEDVSVRVEDGTVLVSPLKETLSARALWGTTAAHVKNMIRGVNTPYDKRLLIEGIGYRASVSGNKLTLNIGFSHPVDIPIPAGIKVSVEKNLVSISGSNKETVGEFAASIRAMKKPEPYKGKGIRYENEIVRVKQGKRAV